MTQDYRITVSVRNNRILELAEQLGMRTVAAISRASGVSQAEIGRYVNLQTAPINRLGDWRPAALKIAEALACEPDDLWSDEQKTMELETNKAHRAVSGPQLQSIQRTPEQSCLEDQAYSTIHAAVDTLPERQATVLRMRFGLDPYSKEHTLEEIGNAVGVTRERVRQIEHSALRKLRKPQSIALQTLAPLIDLADYDTPSDWLDAI